jgi:kumamolisin
MNPRPQSASTRAKLTRHTTGSRATTAIGASKRRLAPGSRRIGAAPPDEWAEVTVIVRPRSSVPLPSVEELGRQPLAERRHVDLRAFVDVYGADPEDLAAVAAFARNSRLEVVESSVARRSVALEGTVADMAAAFGIKFSRYASPHGEYRGRSGVVRLPRELAPVVQAVLGLDDRPQAHPQIRAQSKTGERRAAARSFTPPEVARLYNFPSRLDGEGQRIAIIELGGGYRRADLRSYFADLGLDMPKITAVSVDGVRNQPGVRAHADSEVMLDVEVIGAIVPGAELLVYFAPLTDRGFVDAVTTAVFDERRPSVISISWGDAESNWSEQARTALDDAFQAAAVLGITVCCVSGDNGWTDGIGTKRAHLDYPASSPYVLACGGTRLEVNDGRIDETVWNNDGNATGGGVSQYYPVPSWQRKVHVPHSHNPGRHRGRGVPDVAGNADPDTGYRIRLNGSELKPLGGTSAVGPLWAALIARMNQHLGTRVGYLNPLLYESIAPAGFNAVTKGSNGGYRARLGWDACTGHGTPDGTRLLAALAARG